MEKSNSIRPKKKGLKMSYTSVYAIYKTKVTPIAELKNGTLTGLAIWDYISQRCWGRDFNLFADGLDGSDFWALWKSSLLSRNEQAVILSTYAIPISIYLLMRVISFFLYSSSKQGLFPFL